MYCVEVASVTISVSFLLDRLSSDEVDYSNFHSDLLPFYQSEHRPARMFLPQIPHWLTALPRPMQSAAAAALPCHHLATINQRRGKREREQERGHQWGGWATRASK